MGGKRLTHRGSPLGKEVERGRGREGKGGVKECEEGGGLVDGEARSKEEEAGGQ
jgi:hypothetical protein